MMKTYKNIYIFFIIIIIFQFFCFETTSFADDIIVTDSNTSSFSSDITTFSPACILMESSTGKVIYENNSTEIRYPASTTKIMTAILTLENCELTDTATASHNAIFSVPPSYTTADIVEGEVLTIEQLLNVLLIPSANDAANILAEHIGGSIEHFSEMMNSKATEIGCKNTHFVNPNGVHDSKHLSTAYDLALIGRYAMQNPIFRSIVCKTHYTLQGSESYGTSDREFNTTNELLKNNGNKSDNYYYEYANGIKTGYTDAARNCLVSSAKCDGLEFIAVVLGGQRTPSGQNARAVDSINMYSYGFDNYSVKKLNEANSVLKQITISNATKDTENLDVLVKDEISVFVNKNNLENLTPNIELNSDLKAPIANGTKIGEISYTAEDIVYTSDLIAGSNVDEKILFLTNSADGNSALIENTSKIVIALLILFLIYKILVPKKKNGRHTKSRR